MEHTITRRRMKMTNDIHTMTASKAFKISPDKVTEEQRRLAKIANFGAVYNQLNCDIAKP